MEIAATFNEIEEHQQATIDPDEILKNLEQGNVSVYLTELEPSYE